MDSEPWRVSRCIVASERADEEGMMGRAIYTVSRPPKLYSETVARAIEQHESVFGSRPAGICVNAADLDRARGAVQVLGLAWEPQVRGGCSQGEIWLEVARE